MDQARTRRRALLLGGGAAALGVAALGAAVLIPGPEIVPEGVRVIEWADLVPGGGLAREGVIEHEEIAALSELLAPVAPGSKGAPPPSSPRAAGAAWSQPAGEVVTALDGQRVRLAGFVVPLGFNDAARVTEFLLVPFVGACIHVPPPPPNQIVLVEAARGFVSRSLFHPVEVTGRLTTSLSETDLAATGYHLAADDVRDHRA